jgi:methionyl-tRNA formyltransferase
MVARLAARRLQLPAMRVALFTRVPEVVVQLETLLRELGHECVGVVTTEGPRGRYGETPLSALLDVRPPQVDVLVASGPARFARLLEALEPDLALSGGFPVRIPADALAVPRHGIVNGHPSPLPRYRGPNPLGWALRNGDAELGFTFHRMDADFDTGPVLTQGSAPLAGAESARDVFETLIGLWATLLPQALERVEAGDPGDPQDEDGASYAGFFEPEYAVVDWTRPAEEVHRQVRAWWIAAARGGVRGPLAELEGERVFVLRTRLDGSGGGTPIDCGDGPIWVLETSPAPADGTRGP